MSYKEKFEKVLEHESLFFFRIMGESPHGGALNCAQKSLPIRTGHFRNVAENQFRFFRDEQVLHEEFVFAGAIIR